MKNNNGITIIALVITIIVLLILAGVSIATLTGDNGLLTKTWEAKNTTEEAEIEEEILLAFIKNEADKDKNSSTDMQDKIKSIFEKSYGKGNIEVNKSGKNYKVKVKDTKTVYRVKSDGTIKKYEEMNPTDVYGKLENDTLYLRATQLNNEYTKINETYNCQTSKFFTVDSITKVVIEEPIAPSITKCMFQRFGKLNKIENIENLHTENCSDMMGMFQGCTSIEELDLSNFDTSKVTTMDQMFWVCSSLKSLDLSNFDTSKVWCMDRMFGYNSLIKELDLSNFDTSNVTTMWGMFFSYSGLTKLDLSNFNTNKVKDMNQMFINCTSLTHINLSNFNTSSVKNMEGMFQSCSSLTQLFVSNFNTSSVTNMNNMFAFCRTLTQLDLSNFNTQGVTSYDNMFSSVTAKIILGENWNSEITKDNTGYAGTQWNT